MASRSCC